MVSINRRISITRHYDIYINIVTDRYILFGLEN